MNSLLRLSIAVALSLSIAWLVGCAVVSGLDRLSITCGAACDGGGAGLGNLQSGADGASDQGEGAAASASGADAYFAATDAALAEGAAGGGNAQDAPSTYGDAQLSDGTGAGTTQNIVLSGAAPTGKRGGDGGSPVVDTCPGSQIIIGYQVTYDPNRYVNSIQVLCGMVRITGSGTYQIIVSPGATLPKRGLTGVSSFSAVCPNNQVVVGIYGRSGLFLDQLGVECAPLTISQNGTFSIATGPITQLPPIGGPGGGPFGSGCPSGQVALGNAIATGFFVDSIDLLCATPTLVGPDM